MGETTAIAWTDHTFNPWMGCSKVSPGCDHCYAEALGKRTGRVDWGDGAERVVTSDSYWRNPLKWNRQAEVEGRRHRVFCASMADVFEGRIDLIPHRMRLFTLIHDTPWLDWQLLTKRPENVALLAPWWMKDGWPPNVWIGTTVEDQERADERVPLLLEIPASVRFLSCEPLLAPIRLHHDWLVPAAIVCGSRPASDESRRAVVAVLRAAARRMGGRFVDWVICGGESGPGHRPLDLEHARALRDQCAAAAVPFFFKQVGGHTPAAGGHELDGDTCKEFPTR